MTTTKIPRSEYPRPQFVREDWVCLNGQWQFEIDYGDSGLERGLLDRELSGEITVPFCPESKLSGIEHVDYMDAVWYRREVEIPAEWNGKRILLHFQAVDYDATVWCNGIEVGRHRGGFSSFSVEITGQVKAGEKAAVVVRARDNHIHPQPRGKQSQRYENKGCLYTRTTGIWQTVWMEAVGKSYLKRPRIRPDVGGMCFYVEQGVVGETAGLKVRMTLSDDEGVVCLVTQAADGDFTTHVTLPVLEDRVKLWGPGEPNLYDLMIELIDGDGNVIDAARSYAGLRSVTIDGKAVKINSKTVFQRLVLDQGYYEDGLMTAPSDAALRKDIELSLAAGFNGARLHQKVFEERFLYWADKLGYIVWGEFGDWGCRLKKHVNDWQQPGAGYITQWLEVLERDYNHPAIVGWCPLNETLQNLTDTISVLDDVTRGMFLATKAMDTTRPVLDTSGYSHRVPETDIYDSHDYVQDPKLFAERHAQTKDGKPFINTGQNGKPWNLAYNGQPFFISEFGGIRWNPREAETVKSWGYGQEPKDIDEFYARFEGLCNVLLDDASMFGYCYTQLTDVFQEQNGIYEFDRGEKFDMERIRKIQQKVAAIEK